MSEPVTPNDSVTVSQDPSASVASHRDETATAAPRPNPDAPPFGPPAAAGEVGTLGPFRVVKPLGQGGMGAVYLVVDTRLDRKLALKVMLPAFAADRDAKERFLREARAAAQISHDNVVTVHEADERNGMPYITMPLLQGFPLDAYLKTKGTPPLPHVVRIAREAALGLGAAHARGLVHRDIKPANLWLEAPGGRVKVLDFGLAKPVGSDAELTKSGAVMGTPAYMSPEQARGMKVDHRTDLFSLGAVLYRLCTGRNPFDGPTIMAVLMALGTEEPTPVRALNPAIPEALAELVHHLLAKKPEDRPQTAAEVAKRLRGVLDQLAAPAPAAAVIAAGLSTSQPVVVSPVPVQPPAVTQLRIPAAPEPAPVPSDEALAAAEDEPTEVDEEDEADARPRVKARGKRRWAVAGLAVALAAVAAVAAVVVVRIKNKDGTETVIAVPDGATVVVEQNGKEVATVGPPPAVVGPPLSPYDKLDRKDIPPRELAIAGEGDPANAPAGLVAIGGDSGFHHWRNVVYVGFQDAGKTLVTASKDGTLRYWDHATRTLKRSVRLPIWTHIIGSHTFDLSPDGSLAAIVEYDKLVIRRTDTFEPVYTLPRMWGHVRFSPDGNWLAVAGVVAYTAARLIDTQTFQAVELDSGIAGEPGELFSRVPAFSPDGKTVALGGRTGKQSKLFFYEVPTGKLARTLPTSFGTGSNMCWHPSGKFLAVEWGGKIFVIDATTGVVDAEVNSGRGIHRMVVDPSGRFLVTGEYDSVRVRDWGKWSDAGRHIEMHWGEVAALAISSGGAFAAGNSAFGVNMFRFSGTDPAGQDRPSALRDPWLLWPTPDGRRVIRATDQLEWLAIDRPGLPVAERLAVADAKSHGGGAVSLDGRRFAAVTGEGVTVWDLATRRPNKPFSVPKARAVPPAGLSATGDRLVVVREDGSAVLLALPSGTVVSEFPAMHKDGVSAAVSPDGKWVVLASSRVKAATLFDAATGKAVRELERGHPSLDWFDSARLAFSPDGGRVVGTFSRWTFAESYCGGVLECWDVATGKRTFNPIGHQCPNFAIRSDSREVARADSDGTVRLIDLDTGKQTRRIEVGPPNGVIFQVAYAPDGRHLLTANGNGTTYVIRLSDVGTPVPSADRTAAEWVLSIGGRVRVDRIHREIAAVADLPLASFKLTNVDLLDNKNITEVNFAILQKCKHLACLELSNSSVTDGSLFYLKNCKSLTEIHLHSTAVTDEGVKHLKDCSNLTFVGLGKTRVTDAGLAFFNTLKELTVIGLDETSVTDTGLAMLKDCNKIRVMHLQRTKITGTGLVHLQNCTAIEELRLDNTPITDKGLAVLKDCKNLNYLNLGHTRVTGAGLAVFKDCNSLTELHLSDTLVTDAGIFYFKDCKCLTHLNLTRAPVTDAGLTVFSECKNLNSLFLTDTLVTNAGLATLKDCKNLITLSLHGTRVTDAGLAHLLNHPALKNLSLHNTRVTDEGLMSLTALKLEDLSLQGTAVSDNSLNGLAAMRTLTHIDLRNTKVTAAGIEKLEKALPKCRVEWEPTKP